MSARPSLSARLAKVAAPARTQPAEPDEAPVPTRDPPRPKPAGAKAKAVQTKGREGKSMIAGYFSTEMARAVKLLAVERGVTVQALIGEGLDLVLRQAGKHPMGER